MKPFFKIIALLLLLLPLCMNAQSDRGFDYGGHRKMNKKAARWGKHRVKASKGDYTNLQCSVRKTRRHARRSAE